MNAPKKSTKREQYEQMDIGKMLLTPGFAPSNTTMSLDPITPISMEVTLDQLRPYDRNPRKTKNPKYDEIKDSIRQRGLDAPPAISRRPGEPHYVIVNGGNTRLQILNELYAETRDQQFFRIQCLFKPWQSETSALIGHLVENEQRGDMTFIEKALAIREAQQLLEAESGESLSQRKLADALREQGFSINHAHISRMFHAMDYLLPTIPTLLYGGMGKPQIEKAITLRSAGWAVVKGFQPDADDEIYSLRFAAALQPLEDEGAWDYDALKEGLAKELAVWLAQPHSHMLMELDTRSGERGRELTATPIPPVVSPLATSPVASAAAPNAAPNAVPNAVPSAAVVPAASANTPADSTPSSSTPQATSPRAAAANAPVQEESLQPSAEEEVNKLRLAQQRNDEELARINANWNNPESKFFPHTLPGGTQVAMPRDVIANTLSACNASRLLSLKEGEEISLFTTRMRELDAANPLHAEMVHVEQFLKYGHGDALRYFFYRTPQAEGSKGLELNMRHSRIYHAQSVAGLLRSIRSIPQQGRHLFSFIPWVLGYVLHIPANDAEIALFHQRYTYLAMPQLYAALWEWAGYNNADVLSHLMNEGLLPAVQALVDQGIDDPIEIRMTIRNRLWPDYKVSESATLGLYAVLDDNARAWFLMCMESYRNLVGSSGRWLYADLCEHDPLVLAAAAQRGAQP